MMERIKSIVYHICLSHTTFEELCLFWVMMAGLILGGMGVAAAYWVLDQYFKERQRRAALDPSTRKYIPKLRGDVTVDWSDSYRSRRQELSPEEMIQQARVKLRVDTENTTNIAVCCLLYTSPSPRD